MAKVTRTIQVPVQRTRQVPTIDESGAFSVKTVTETVMQSKTIVEEVPDPPKPKAPTTKLGRKGTGDLERSELPLEEAEEDKSWWQKGLDFAGSTLDKVKEEVEIQVDTAKEAVGIVTDAVEEEIQVQIDTTKEMVSTVADEVRIDLEAAGETVDAVSTFASDVVAVTGHDVGWVGAKLLEGSGKAQAWVNRQASEGFAWALDQTGNSGAAKKVRADAGFWYQEQRLMAEDGAGGFQSFGDGLGEGLAGVAGGVGALFKADTYRGLSELASNVPGPNPLFLAKVAGTYAGGGSISDVMQETGGFWKNFGGALWSDTTTNSATGKADFSYTMGRVAAEILPFIASGGTGNVAKATKASDTMDNLADTGRTANLAGKAAKDFFDPFLKIKDRIDDFRGLTTQSEVAATAAEGGMAAEIGQKLLASPGKWREAMKTLAEARFGADSPVTKVLSDADAVMAAAKKTSHLVDLDPGEIVGSLYRATAGQALSPTQKQAVKLMSQELKTGIEEAPAVPTGFRRKDR